MSWCTVGDFSVITCRKEMFGEIFYDIKKSFEFISIIDAYGLLDLRLNGQKYTWSTLGVLVSESGKVGQGYG